MFKGKINSYVRSYVHRINFIVIIGSKNDFVLGDITLRKRILTCPLPLVKYVFNSTILIYHTSENTPINSFIRYDSYNILMTSVFDQRA